MKGIIWTTTLRPFCQLYVLTSDVRSIILEKAKVDWQKRQKCISIGRCYQHVQIANSEMLRTYLPPFRWSELTALSSRSSCSSPRGAARGVPLRRIALRSSACAARSVAEPSDWTTVCWVRRSEDIRGPSTVFNPKRRLRCTGTIGNGR